MKLFYNIFKNAYKYNIYINSKNNFKSLSKLFKNQVFHTKNK